jgi:hypothetical protein
MATFQSRVETLSGTVPNNDQLSWWLTAGARILVNLVPSWELYRYVADIPVTQAGTTITDGYILSATKNGYPCKAIPPSAEYAVTRSDSIYSPSDKMPILLVKGTTAKIFPNGGHIQMLPVYIVLHTDTGIAQFPDELEQGVVLYACILNKSAQMSALMGTIQVLYTDAVSSTIGTTVIDSIPTPPSYTPPTPPTIGVFSTTAPVAPTITDLTIALTPPEPPEITPFSFSEDIEAPSAEELIETSAEAPEPPEIPTYTAPTVTAPEAPTIDPFAFSENVEIPVFDTSSIPEAPTFTDITIPVGIAIPEMVSDTTNILFTAATAAGIDPETIAALATPVPVYTKVNPTLSFANFTTRAGADDVEMAQTYLAEVDRLLADWRQDVEEELNEFNAEYQVWRAQVERTMEQARINLQQKIQDAQQKDQMAQFNKLKEFELTLEEFRAQYQIQQINIERYVQYVNAEVQRRTANISAEVQVYVAEVRALIDVFQVEIQGYTALVGAEIQAYRAEVEGKTQNFSNETNYYVTVLKTTIEQWATEAQTIAALYNSSVQGYATEVGAASDQNNARTSRFQAEIQKYVAMVEKEIRGWQVNAEVLLSSYRTQMDGYSTQVNSLVQIYATSASARSQIYQAQISGFATEAGVVAQRNEVLLGEYAQRMQNAMNVMQTSAIEFQASIQRSIEQAQLTQQRLIQQAAQDADISKTNRAMTMQAKVSEYQIKLERMNTLSVELQSFMVQYQEVVTRYVMRHYPNLYMGAQR